MTDAKPLTIREIEEIFQAVEFAGSPDRRVDRLLATIRRRDELICWLVDYFHIEPELLSCLEEPQGHQYEATDVIAIVEAGGGR